jgi:hypothetical protein
MRPSDIINKSDKGSKERATSQGIGARLYKVEDNKIIYTVDSSQHDKQYYVTVQLLDLTGNKLKSLKQSLSGSVRVHCTCPAFLYSGFKYITYKSNAGINKEDRAPVIKNPNKEGMACKHIIVALNQMKKDYTAIYSMFKEQNPKKSELQKSTSAKDNSNSTVPTETDIEIITDFKSACDKLYKDYISYKNSGPTKVSLFTDSDFYDGKDPSVMLKDLSKPVAKSLNNKFIGKLKSVQDILKLIDQKKNGFNIMLDSDVKSLISKLNASIETRNESFINNIILNLICS